VERVGADKNGCWVVLENPTANPTANPTVNSLGERILEILRENPSATYAELAEITGKNRDTMASHLKKLQENGLVERVGADKNGHWKVLEGK
ncbi:MAG: winged helix-turn-helix transcriptional regulator, partial [Fibrobacteraceae bacterium]|nr:winged helix-turn-helix transcriptional regulator [Fibrobacteraceae bacterium]